MRFSFTFVIVIVIKIDITIDINYSDDYGTLTKKKRPKMTFDQTFINAYCSYMHIAGYPKWFFTPAVQFTMCLTYISYGPILDIPYPP